MEQAIEYFTVFGGLDEQIDTTIPIEKSIEELILDEYKYYRNQVADLCTSDPLLQAILSGVALGDRRTNSAFRRAQVSFKNGMECVDELRDMGVLKVESTMHHLTNQANQGDISKKLIITTPFLRFWFAFVSPYIQRNTRWGLQRVFHQTSKIKKKEFPKLHFFKQLLSMEYCKKKPSFPRKKNLIPFKGDPGKKLFCGN